MLSQFVVVGSIAALPRLDIDQPTLKVKVERNFANYEGVVETDEFDCVVWKMKAHEIANQTCIGQVVGIKGRIQMEGNSPKLIAEQINLIAGIKS